MIRRLLSKMQSRVRVFGITASVGRHVLAIIVMAFGATLVGYSFSLMTTFRSYDDEISMNERRWEENKNSTYWGPGLSASNRLHELKDMGRFRYELTPYWIIGLSVVVAVLMVLAVYNVKDGD